MVAIRPARWSGAAPELNRRKTPRKAEPKPKPAIAVPTRNNDAVLVAIAPSVTPIPARSIKQPTKVARLGSEERSSTEATNPTPVSRKMTRPPHSTSFEDTSSETSDGPRDKYSPPSAHK